MTLFGFICIGGLAVYLMLFEGSPGPLAAPHAAVVKGRTIFSCRACHSADGIDNGCLGCHVEIAAQRESGRGYHAWQEAMLNSGCADCHSEHNGADFDLAGKLSWGSPGREAFRHRHVEFGLTGRHEGLSCADCHNEKLAGGFALPPYAGHPRDRTFLGLSQDCIHCHADVHGSGEMTRSCRSCHDQERFKPAAFFDHNKFYRLEGVHAAAECTGCHRRDDSAIPGAFGAVRGTQCADCHDTPHRAPAIQRMACTDCHYGSDGDWSYGRRGVSDKLHAEFGFTLEPPHTGLDCGSCHSPGGAFSERFLLPLRENLACHRCHADPHDAQFPDHRENCLTCHSRHRFVPSILTPQQHTEFPLQGAHGAVACIQCHTVEPQSGVRRFTDTPTACKACHDDPHGGQFIGTPGRGDCSDCHGTHADTFRIEVYTHEGSPGFFAGKGHRQAACSACHRPPATGRPIVYAATSAACAGCHADPHRGQFNTAERKLCGQCHGSVAQWAADRFSHEKDTGFSLAGAHAKVDCKGCHLPAPQRDGSIVTQYRPTASKCEDCHGFGKE
jgi:predicted CXXCH cytochrome family protein